MYHEDPVFDSVVKGFQYIPVSGLFHGSVTVSAAVYATMETHHVLEEEVENLDGIH